MVFAVSAVIFVFVFVVFFHCGYFILFCCACLVVSMNDFFALVVSVNIFVFVCFYCVCVCCICL